MQKSLSIKSIPTFFEVDQNIVQENECGVWLWEPKSDVFHYSDMYLSGMGYKREEFPASIAEWSEHVHPDDVDSVRKMKKIYVDTAEAGNQFEHPLRIRNAEGKYISILMHGYILERDEEERATKVSGFHILRERLNDLDHEQLRMKFALQAAEDGIWDWNTETGDVYYSPRYTAMVGYSKEEFLPIVDSWATRVHPDDFQSTVAKQLQIISCPTYGDSFECVYRFLHKNGSWKWFLGKGVVTCRNSHGRARRVTGVHIDIDELQEAKEKLITTLKKDTLTAVHSRYSFEQRLNALESHDFPVSLIYVDVDGLKIVNDLLGHTFGDEYLRDISEMLIEHTREQDLIYRIGGDEFAILLTETKPAHSNDVLVRLADKVEEQNQMTGSMFVSFGLATAAVPAELSVLTSNADSQMYQNKRKNQERRHELLRNYCVQVLKTNSCACG